MTALDQLHTYSVMPSPDGCQQYMEIFRRVDFRDQQRVALLQVSTRSIDHRALAEAVCGELDRQMALPAPANLAENWKSWRDL